MYMKAAPTTYVLHFRDGKAVHEGPKKNGAARDSKALEGMARDRPESRATV